MVPMLPCDCHVALQTHKPLLAPRNDMVS